MRKDTTLTIRMPRRTRKQLEAVAKKEGRSLSQQAERLIERGLEAEAAGGAVVGARSLAGLFARETSPSYGDFRAVRTLLSDALPRRDGRGSTGR